MTQQDLENIPATDEQLWADLWERFSKMDVSDYVEQGTKGGRKFSYLGWEAAWTLFRNECPHGRRWDGEDILMEDGSVEVEVWVQVGEAKGYARLAVMNQSFQGISNPTSRQVNDARQRCLVKALAINFGLGLSLWTENPDVAVGTMDECIDEYQADSIRKMVEKTGSDLQALLDWARVEKLEDMPAKKYTQARAMLRSKAA